MRKIIGFILLLGLIFACEKSVLLEEVSSNAEPTFKSAPTDIIVPDDFTTIQEAVNAAEDGTTIIIKEGVYPELVLIQNQNDLTLIGQDALICPPDGAVDPDMNIVILESSNIKVLNLKFDGKNDAGEYPVYCAIAFTSSSGEASHNKIEGYGGGIACFNTNPAPGVQGEVLDLKFSHNNISEVNGAGINLIGNFNVDINHNSIICSNNSFGNFWYSFFGINMEGGTGTISKNKIRMKNNSDLPITSIGIRLMMRNPAPHNAGMMADLHDVDVSQCIINGADVGIMVNSYDPLPDPEVWCVHGVSLLNNKFIKVGLLYEINNECEDIEIKP